MSQVTLGGERLGAGNKQKVELHNYERSTHDLSYLWRSTMASGTLVPFMKEVALPGDNFDIDLNVDIKTHPTVGPLFGRYKIQLDVFSCPVRLYHGKLHMNMLNIGLNMSQIKLPQLLMSADGDPRNIGDNTQINPSSIFSYLDIRGLGTAIEPTTTTEVVRSFNALPYLMYWDIVKNYYSNKQEEIGAVIHNDMEAVTNPIVEFGLWSWENMNYTTIPSTNTGQSITMAITNGATSFPAGNIYFTNQNEPDPSKIFINFGNFRNLTEIFDEIKWNEQSQVLELWNPKAEYTVPHTIYNYVFDGFIKNPQDGTPRIVTFPLENIDTMREMILTETQNPNPFKIGASEHGLAPYGLPLGAGTYGYSKTSKQEGLALKTYQSDLLNNWISTEWIDGDNGINSITAVDTSNGYFTIDSLQLSKKVYDMLNRIAISGGTYDDWLNAVYTHERTRGVENPMYMGGLIKELAFQEVISNAAATNQEIEQPLGTLAGRGVMTNKHKGGKIKIRVDEPSYIIGIISLTPLIDYSQSNKWDVNLKTMDDFHKPGLDQIGFQDSINDARAWFSTKLTNSYLDEPTYTSAGKVPAWLNYMTNVNQVKGNFAENEQKWMTLVRRYEQDENGIKDLTTYIDPTKFNHIFADTRLDAQNFWAQIGVNITARRKMSAKLMPNL